LEADERILVVYLFGSRSPKRDRANDQAEAGGDERDLDLAIVTRSGFAWDDYYRLIERVGGALHSDRVDLLWLNQTDPVMTFQVIRGGAPLLYRSASVLNEFERKAKQRYYDYQIYLRKRRMAGGI
jgi:predicted nucleotidyltransferase